MQVPFRRDALREREQLDQLDERRAASEESASSRVELSVELSDLAREIGEGARALWVTTPRDDLAEKARIYGLALKVAAQR